MTFNLPLGRWCRPGNGDHRIRHSQIVPDVRSGGREFSPVQTTKSVQAPDKLREARSMRLPDSSGKQGRFGQLSRFPGLLSASSESDSRLAPDLGWAHDTSEILHISNADKTHYVSYSLIIAADARSAAALCVLSRYIWRISH